MPVSRGRKPKKKRQKRHQSEIQQAGIATTSEKTFWERVQTHPVPWAIGLLAALIAIGEPTREAVRQPEIHAHSGRIDAPLELRFSLRNPSWLFWMKDVQFTCIIKDILLSGNNRFVNSRFSVGASKSVRPGQIVEYACPFDRAVYLQNLPIVSANIAIAVDFKTLWLSRSYESEPFTWNEKTKQWLEGEPAD